MVEVNNKRQRLGHNKLGDLILSEFLSQSSLAIIKCLGNKDTLARDIIFSTGSLISSDTKWKIIKIGSSGQVSLGSISGLILETSNNSNSLSFNESLDFLCISQSLGRWTSLLLNPVNNGVSSSATSVLHGLAILEELQCGVSSDLELLSQLGLLCSINLGQLDWRVLLSQHTSSFGIFRSKGFTMAAPWSIKFNQDKFISIHSLFKVVICEHQLSLFLLDLSLHQGTECQHYKGLHYGPH